MTVHLTTPPPCFPINPAEYEIVGSLIWLVCPPLCDPRAFSESFSGTLFIAIEENRWFTMEKNTACKQRQSQTPRPRSSGKENSQHNYWLGIAAPQLNFEMRPQALTSPSILLDPRFKLLNHVQPPQGSGATRAFHRPLTDSWDFGFGATSFNAGEP